MHSKVETLGSLTTYTFQIGFFTKAALLCYPVGFVSKDKTHRVMLSIGKSSSLCLLLLRIELEIKPSEEICSAIETGHGSCSHNHTHIRANPYPRCWLNAEYCCRPISPIEKWIEIWIVVVYLCAHPSCI